MANDDADNQYYFNGYVGFQVGYLAVLGIMCMCVSTPSRTLERI